MNKRFIAYILILLLIAIFAVKPIYANAVEDDPEQVGRKTIFGSFSSEGIGTCHPRWWSVIFGAMGVPFFAHWEGTFLSKTTLTTLNGDTIITGAHSGTAFGVFDIEVDNNYYQITGFGFVTVDK